MAAELFASYNLCGFFRIKIRILKQAAVENVDQKTFGGQLHALTHRFLAVFLTADLIRLDNRTGLAVSAELVNPVCDRQQTPFCLGHILHAVAAASKSLNRLLRILGDAPVGADNAFEFIFSAQQILDQVLAVGVSDVLAVFLVHAVGYGVVRHNRGCAVGRSVQAERCLGKWF